MNIITDNYQFYLLNLYGHYTRTQGRLGLILKVYYYFNIIEC